MQRICGMQEALAADPIMCACYVCVVLCCDLRSHTGTDLFVVCSYQQPMNDDPSIDAMSRSVH